MMERDGPRSKTIGSWEISVRSRAITFHLGLSSMQCHRGGAARIWLCRLNTQFSILSSQQSSNSTDSNKFDLWFLWISYREEILTLPCEKPDSYLLWKPFSYPTPQKADRLVEYMMYSGFLVDLQMWQLYDGAPAASLTCQQFLSPNEKRSSCPAFFFLSFLRKRCIGFLRTCSFTRSTVLCKTGLMDSQGAQRCPPRNAICHISMTIPAFPWLSN